VANITIDVRENNAQVLTDAGDTILVEAGARLWASDGTAITSTSVGGHTVSILGLMRVRNSDAMLIDFSANTEASSVYFGADAIVRAIGSLVSAFEFGATTRVVNAGYVGVDIGAVFEGDDSEFYNTGRWDARSAALTFSGDRALLSNSGAIDLGFVNSNFITQIFFGDNNTLINRESGQFNDRLLLSGLESTATNHGLMAGITLETGAGLSVANFSTGTIDILSATTVTNGDATNYINNQGIITEIDLSNMTTDIVIRNTGSIADNDEGALLLGSGNDEYRGASGTVRSVFAGEGDDLVIVGDGGQVVHADAGNDRVYGNGGDDDIRGGAGDDVLIGGDGADTLDGTLGVDKAFGGAGNDIISHVDFASGGDGDDMLGLDHEADTHLTLNGDAGDDTFDLLEATAESTGLMRGGEGDDLFQLGAFGNYTLRGGAGQDTVEFTTNAFEDFTITRRGERDQGLRFEVGEGDDVRTINVDSSDVFVFTDTTLTFNQLLALLPEIQRGETPYATPEAQAITWEAPVISTSDLTDTSGLGFELM
jgi:serralysin